MKNTAFPLNFLLHLGCLLFTIQLLGADSLRIEYIGNMGVMILGEKESILIDGLHQPYRPAYLAPSASLISRLIDNETQPATHWLLNTHVHKDHFDEDLVNRFLSTNSRATFIGTEQANEALSALAGSEQMAKRRLTIRTDTDEVTHFSFGDLSIEGFFLRHVNPARHQATKNVGYVLTLDSLRILHAGDTDWNGTVFQRLKLSQEPIDVAILPNWMVMTDQGAQVVRQYIRPRHIIVTHISPFRTTEVREAVARYFPAAILFTKIGQVASF